MKRYERVLLVSGIGTKLCPLAHALSQTLNEYGQPAHNAENIAKCTSTLQRRKSEGKMLYQFIYTL